jgi:hypothetical protein
MNEDEFSQYISAGREQRSIEFKCAGPRTNKQLLVQVVRAALGMANNRDGGIIIVGIDEKDEGQPQLTGLSQEDLKTWGFDSLSDSFAEYADPTISFDTEIADYRSSKFLVIHVHEFTDTPIICKKSYPDVLRAGACYVRPRRKPETIEPPSHADMQDLLNLAIEKGVRRFISQATNAGLSLSNITLPSDQDRFTHQIENFVNPQTCSDLGKKIYSRGYWITRIWPGKFQPKKIADISSMFPLIQQLIVKIRGWDFPHLDLRNRNQIGIDSIGQDLEFEHRLSSWRFFQSGQFVDVAGISIDWRDQSSFWPPSEDWKPGQLLGIGDTIATLTEIIELASRLSTSDAGDENMHISIVIGNLKDRMLYVDDSNRWPLDYPRQATINEYPIDLDLTRSELITNAKTIALEQALEFFKRFNFITTIEILRSWQEKINR